MFVFFWGSLHHANKGFMCENTYCKSQDLGIINSSLESCMNEKNKGLSSTLQPITVVTGGSKGIGKSLAREFARQGHDIMLVARGTEELATACEELRKETAAKIYSISLDLLKPDASEILREEMEAAGFYTNVLINNAGMGLSGAFQANDIDKIEALIQLNVSAVTSLMRCFLPDFVKRGRGGILNVASLAGMVPMPYLSVYGASKTYVIALSEALSFEYREAGVQISVLAPGPVATEFRAQMGLKAGWMHSFLPMMDTEMVARVGYNGFAIGQSVIVPGFLNKISAFGIKILPSALLLPVLGAMGKWQTADSP